MTAKGPYQPRDRSVHPAPYFPDYKTTVFRSPQRPLLSFSQSLSEVTGPTFGQQDLEALDNDLLLNAQVDAAPIGERIIVHGRVLDQNARPVPDCLIEVWQANASGKYRHVKDGYLGAHDPNFSGYGRCLTDAEGRYAFRTVKPGPYPWPNGVNDWRPAHIHFSLFGPAFATRLVSQMYFEGDPLIPLCPIVQSISDQEAVARLVAPLDMTENVPMDCLAYRFDVVLRGRKQTFFENKPEGA
ncbi:protocatechuate 3,4-dioxygenase subunit beta [Rhodovibrionaceae bacterium A322]